MTSRTTLQFWADHVGKTGKVDVTLPVACRDEPVHIAGLLGALDRAQPNRRPRSTRGMDGSQL